MADTQKLIENMNAVLASLSAKSPLKNPPADDAVLPFDAPEEFSEDPILFAEETLTMLHRTREIYELTRNLDRHSASYLKACDILDQGIRYLAGSCLSIAALQRRRGSSSTESDFPPELEELTSDELFRMASYNFRKCDRAFTEIKPEDHDRKLCMYKHQSRFFNLLERLRATEAKFYRIRHNYIPASNYICGVLAFTPKSWTRSFKPAQQAAPFRKAPAFSPQQLPPATGSEARSNFPAPQPTVVAHAAERPQLPSPAAPAPGKKIYSDPSDERLRGITWEFQRNGNIYDMPAYDLCIHYPDSDYRVGVTRQILKNLADHPREHYKYPHLPLIFGKVYEEVDKRGGWP